MCYDFLLTVFVVLAVVALEPFLQQSFFTASLQLAISAFVHFLPLQSFPSCAKDAVNKNAAVARVNNFFT